MDLTNICKIGFLKAGTTPASRAVWCVITVRSPRQTTADAPRPTTYPPPSPLAQGRRGQVEVPMHPGCRELDVALRAIDVEAEQVELHLVRVRVGLGLGLGFGFGFGLVLGLRLGLA